MGILDKAAGCEWFMLGVSSNLIKLEYQTLWIQESGLFHQEENTAFFPSLSINQDNDNLLKNITYLYFT